MCLFLTFLFEICAIDFNKISRFLNTLASLNQNQNWKRKHFEFNYKRTIWIKILFLLFWFSQEWSRMWLARGTWPSTCLVFLLWYRACSRSWFPCIRRLCRAGTQHRRRRWIERKKKTPCPRKRLRNETKRTLRLRDIWSEMSVI